MRKIYVASSWRNIYQPAVVDFLRSHGHEVYDFRNPAEGNTGFSWVNADLFMIKDTVETEYCIKVITNNEVCAEGFKLDMDALEWCDTVVLVLPCGNSAHLEAGWAAGAGKTVLVLNLAWDMRPDLMLLMCDSMGSSLKWLLSELER